MNSKLHYNTILDLWFAPETKPYWYNSTKLFDAQLIDNHTETYLAAINLSLDEWRNSALGSLALVIVLDQFPLHIYRGQPECFVTGELAISVAQHALDKKQDLELNDEQKSFLYLPYMHSENRDHQHTAKTLYTTAGLTDNLKYAKHHESIIRRFERFPHRNVILGRENTPAEKAYLSSKEAFLG